MSRHISINGRNFCFHVNNVCHDLLLNTGVRGTLESTCHPDNLFTL
jgi:hypothetical protein